VEAFLRDYAGRPFSYGTTDCVLFLADWLLICGRNRDVAEEYRGTYTDEDACFALLRAKGGLLRLVAREARELALRPVRPATAPCGAIGVIRYRPEGENERHLGAIRCPSGRWASKCTHGLLMVGAPRVAAAWEVL
jgi:hypothetical protein